MSVYEERYQVSYGTCMTAYTSDPREVVRIADDPKYGGIRFVNEGYADTEDIYPGHPRYGGIEGTEYVRRTTRSVSVEELRVLAKRLELRDVILNMTDRERVDFGRARALAEQLAETLFPAPEEAADAA